MLNVQIMLFNLVSLKFTLDIVTKK